MDVVPERRQVIDPLAIEHEGKPTHVLVRFTDREHVREIPEDAEDLAAVRRMESDPNRDRVPLAIGKRLLDDENLLKVWRGHRGLTRSKPWPTSRVCRSPPSHDWEAARARTRGADAKPAHALGSRSIPSAGRDPCRHRPGPRATDAGKQDR